MRAEFYADFRTGTSESSQASQTDLATDPNTPRETDHSVDWARAKSFDGGQLRRNVGVVLTTRPNPANRESNCTEP